MNLKEDSFERSTMLRLFRLNSKMLSSEGYTLGEEETREFGFRASFVLPLGPLSMLDQRKLTNNPGCEVCGNVNINRCNQCLSICLLQYMIYKAVSLRLAAFQRLEIQCSTPTDIKLKSGDLYFWRLGFFFCTLSTLQIAHIGSLSVLYVIVSVLDLHLSVLSVSDSPWASKGTS